MAVRFESLQDGRIYFQERGKKQAINEFQGFIKEGFIGKNPSPRTTLRLTYGS